MKKKLVILGAGESGTGTAILGLQKGYEVWVSDKGTIKEKYRNILVQHQVPFEEGNHSLDTIWQATEVVKSPGIPEEAEVIRSLNKKGIPVISEIEFAGRYTGATKICITGSNGKTTTTSLIHHILNKAGLNAGLAGNVGTSFAMQVATRNFDYYVIELSSFQLDGMYDFKADIAVLMNITPDHLDRYGYSMDRYTDSKFRIVRNMAADDYFIYCSDDPVIMSRLASLPIQVQKLPFSIKDTRQQTAWLDGEKLTIQYKNNLLEMTIYDLALMGQHNTYNSMAAGIAAQVLHIRKDIIRESLSDFKGVEHRLEKVTRVHGIEFINDSKGTNVNSTWYALESMTTKVVWIAGGIDKGNDYESLKDLVRKKVKAIVCLGKDNTKIHKAFGDLVETIVDTQSMRDAVSKCYHLAQKGDTVLLSPACASFDLFENYEDRGRQFKREVKNL
jgi:UDP-N-acetylmuramoylalanine--D-glutamate ligase